MDTYWRIELLGGLRAVHGDRIITRFRSHKTGALLAYLAFHPEQRHPRDLLTDLLWPEEPIESARMRLRTALSSLRRQLEPPGILTGAVIVTDRHSAGLNPAAVDTDVARFEAALQAAARAGSTDTKTRRLAAALELYHGPLLPGYFEAWVLPEQQRLAGLYLRAARELVGYLEGTRDLARALEVAGRAVAADPLHEEVYYDLIRLYAAAGQSATALRHYRSLEERLRDELGETPSEALRQLARRIERDELQPASAPVLPAPRTQEPRRGLRAAPGSASGALLSGADEPRGSLPPLVTRFFGREREMARLCFLLQEEGVRLVNLTGPGGSGKTRLALEAARRLHEALDGAVWFVPLADLAEPRRIIDAIHAALRLPRLPWVKPLEQVVETLSQRPSLLLLDNLEHLLPDAVPIVRDLLEQAPLLQCVATSRQILELPPEREIAVGPLVVPGVQVFRCSGVGDRLAPTPEHLNIRTPEHLMSYPSVALFVDRAQRVRPDFQLTRANAVVVAELCRRLEGIPLALELAAAWVKQLPPAKMLQQLGQRFELLVSRQRDLPSRHQTLRAAIDWSYQLLSPELQRFFARLFIFRGGFTVEAAAAVCESPDQAREYLVMLRSSSLVQAEDDGRETRYRLLETLREFAADQLRTEERDETGRRHAEYYKKLAETAEPHVNGGPLQTQWLDRLEVEHENLRAALTWLQERRHAETGLEFAAALQMFWTARGHLSEGRERLTELLELPESAGKAARARALTRAAAMANRQGDHAAAQVLCERSLEISRKLGHRPLIQQGLFYLGNAFIRQDDPAAAQAAYAESLAIARELDDRLAVARTLRNLGLVARRQGDRPAERALTEESLPLCRELGAHWDMAEAMINLGQNARSQGDDAAAHSFLQESLAIGRELGSQLLVGDVLYFLGLQEQERGDPERAWGYYQESLTHKREIGDR